MGDINARRGGSFPTGRSWGGLWGVLGCPGRLLGGSWGALGRSEMDQKFVPKINPKSKRIWMGQNRSGATPVVVSELFQSAPWEGEAFRGGAGGVRGDQDPPKTAPRPPKIAPRSPKTTPRPPKIAPRPSFHRKRCRKRNRRGFETWKLTAVRL